MQDELIVTLSAIARRYGVSEKQLKKWIRDHGFPAFKVTGSRVWRIRHSSAMRWFRKFEQNPDSPNPCQ